MRNAARLVGIGMLTLVTATPARAQDEATTTPVPRNHVISASPFLLMFKWFNVDYERKVSPAVTVGASASYLPIEGFDYGRATLHARYYPQGAALTGFYVGGQAGVHRAGTKRDGYQFRPVPGLKIQRRGDPLCSNFQASHSRARSDSTR